MIRFLKKKILETLKFCLKNLSNKRVLIISPDKLKWININCDLISRELIKKLIYVDNYYVNKFQQKEIDTEIIKNYKGVNLSDAILYSVCVELEIMPWEFNTTQTIHLEVEKKWLLRAIEITDDLNNKIKSIKPNLIIYLQGYILETNIARQLAKLYKIKTIALELTFNPYRIILETISGIAVNKTSAKSLFWNYENSILNKEIDKWFNENWNSIQSNKHHDHISSKNPLNETRNIDILYLGQVYTDSSSIYGLNKNLVNQETIISNLIQIAKEMNLNLLVKLHPKENEGLDPVNLSPLNKLTWRKLNLLNLDLSANPLVKIDYKNEYNTEKLIANSKIIITINSQAGLEAAIKGKVVILCGSSFYDNLNFTNTIHNYDELLNIIKNINLNKQELFYHNQDLAKRFAYIYFKYFCVSKNTKSIVNKIETML